MDILSFLATALPQIKKEERLEFTKEVFNAVAGRVDFQATPFPASLPVKEEEEEQAGKTEELVAVEDMSEKDFNEQIVKGGGNA